MRENRASEGEIAASPLRKRGEKGPPGFEAFWQSYPRDRRRNRPKALALWLRLGCEEFVEKVVGTIERLKAEDDGWRRGFSPEPHRWLAAEGWNDEPRAPPLPGARTLTADERQLEAIRQNTERFERLARESHEPERSDPHREHPELTLPAILVERKTGPLHD